MHAVLLGVDSRRFLTANSDGGFAEAGDPENLALSGRDAE